jgi:hypothetical protein
LLPLFIFAAVTKNKNFPIFFFKISESNLAYFVENFIAILTGIFENFGHREFREKNPKNPKKTEKSSKNEMFPGHFGILTSFKNVHSGLK